ncbi:8-oxoguanine DNA glycosylase [Pseudomonas syringae]
MQTGVVVIDSIYHSAEFPSPETEVVSGVKWGLIEAFPSPAYWAYQLWANTHLAYPIIYKLGNTLTEEVAACLLGGHGIPAAVGLSAFAHLRIKGVFEWDHWSEDMIFEVLSEPLKIDGKSVKYRFARQKARYLSAAMSHLQAQQAPLHSGRALRDWLLEIPGVGYKTASWIARNHLGADDVAILDIHILRAGQLGGFFTQGLTVERHYLRLEKEFLALSRGLGVRASDLDALIWLQMMSSPSVVHGLLGVFSAKAA